MNQGKLEVVKQEVARVNNILGISDLKWTAMGEFNSDDYYFILFYFIFKLYIIVLVLPNIKMNPPQVYMRSPS